MSSAYLKPTKRCLSLLKIGTLKSSFNVRLNFLETFKERLLRILIFANWFWTSWCLKPRECKHHRQDFSKAHRFLFARLHFEILSRQKTPKKLRAALQKLPDNLGDIYDSLMDRILSAEDEKDIAIYALKWVTYSRERLPINALLHAIAVELGLEGDDIEDDDLIDPKDLLSSCGGLLVFDEESDVVRLVHYTTQTYLEGAFAKREANTLIAKTCLTYLALDVFQNELSLDSLTSEFMRQYSLGGYASTHWGHHVGEGNEEEVEQQIIHVFRDQHVRDCVEGMKMVHEYGRTYKCSKFSLLHLISIYGLSRVCATLFKRHVDIDVESRDAKGRSPLTWAAHNGHLQVVKLVLDAGAKVGSADEEGHTPLSCAARNGYLDVVKWLLHASYGVDSGDELDALTALRWATMTGHLEVVKLLLDAQTKKNPSFGQRAFGWAATYGHFEVMKLLMNNM